MLKEEYSKIISEISYILFMPYLYNSVTETTIIHSNLIKCIRDSEG